MKQPNVQREPNRPQAASRGAGAPAAQEAGEGDTRKRLDDKTPPLTNRGCLTPEEIVFHLDYLKVTIFEPAEEVQQIVENALLEKAGMPCGEWIDKGSVQRWEHIYEGPGPIALLEPQYQQFIYSVVEIKGEGAFD